MRSLAIFLKERKDGLPSCAHSDVFNKKHYPVRHADTNHRRP